MNDDKIKKKNRATKLRGPVKAMTTHTFVRGYKVNSQMNINTINGANISSRACRLIKGIYDAMEEEEDL